MDHQHGRRADERRLTIAFFLTAGFMFAEFGGGLWTGSLALLADAGHMLNDTVALGLAVGALRIAEKPPDAKRSYGYGRIQILAAFTNALLLCGIAIWIGWQAFGRLREPHAVLSGPMLAIAAGGLLVNLGALYLLRSSDRQNLNIRGALVHIAGDLIGSCAAILAALLILFFGWRVADPVLSLVVVAIILVSAISVIKESGHILLEGTPRGVSGEAVGAGLKAEIPEIEDVHHVHIWSLDSDETMITLHVVLRAGADREAALAAAQKHLAAQLGHVHATIQVESGVCASPERSGQFAARC
jgi:cobalt-zinc-cadmium efflux system protein